MGSKSEEEGGRRLRLQFGPFRCDVEVSDPDDGEKKSSKDFDPFNLVIGVLPDPVQGHLKNARVEVLKAMRAMIDVRIDRAEKADEGDGEPRVQKVPVE